MTNGTAGVVAERGGVDNGTLGVPTARDRVLASSIDGSSGFVEQSSVATDYGTFTISAIGRWYYRLDDANAAVQGLNAGDTLHDRITVTTTGGTPQVIDITIDGADDAARIVGTAAGRVTEKGGIANGTAGDAAAKGKLGVSDVDNLASFVVQIDATMDYGRFTIDAAGRWSYRLDDGNAAVQALNAGDALHELITVTAADGTTRQVDITIEGANDAARIFGTSTGAVGEKGGIANGTAGDAAAKGKLGVSDVDNPSTFVARTDAATDYGTFSIDVTGLWRYALDDNNAAVQALNAGDTLHDLVTVSAADGTTRVIDITIEGADDAARIFGTATGRVAEKGGVANGTAGDAATKGKLGISDVDSPSTFVAQTAGATDYGTFSIDAAGAWRYALDDNNAAVQALNTGDTLHDLITVSAADGTTKVIDIAIEGGNDAARVFGTSIGTVTEKGGVANGTPGDAATKGKLGVSDVDSPASFVAQTDAATDHGTFSIDATGLWRYALDDGNAAVQAQNAGDALHDLVTVATADGTTKVIDIAIEGANDAAVITGAAARSVREKSGVGNGAAGVATASGDLHAIDVDSSAAFVAQNDVAKTYGAFTIDATGTWSYTLDDGNADVQALNAGDTLHEVVTVATADGTTKVIDITIKGANDAAVITGTAAGTVTEKGGVANGTAGIATADGDLDATDVDSDATFVAQTDASETYGTFSINSSGVWSYTLDDDNEDVQALNPGETLHELVTVATADGTTQQIDITIEGAEDTTRIVGPSTGTVVEAGGVWTAGVPSATGDLDVVDVDTATSFVPQTGVAADYGTFSIDAAGNWTYTLDNANPDVEALDGGETLHDLIEVATGNGTTQQIDITVDGAMDSGFDLTWLAPAQGFIIQGDDPRDRAGWSVASAGDVNGDGFDDMIVGSPYADVNGKIGIAHVVFGRASGFGSVDGTGRSVINLKPLTIFGATADGFVIEGDAPFDQAGTSVSSAGDVNGDGFADLVVGALGGDDAGNAAGEAYVVFGKATGFARVDLTTLAPGAGFVVQGDAAGDLAGNSVASAGDVNGDGFADLIVGARGNDDGGSYAGEAYVVFGRASGFGTVDGTGRSVIDLTTLSPDDGFIVQGDAANDRSGTSVSSAGDVNGDGFADLVVDASNGDGGGAGAGEAYVIFGRATGFGSVDGTGRSVIDLTTLPPADGFIIQGDAAFDRAGSSVSSAGDVNGDGFDDVIVGAPLGDDAYANSGEAYVVFGRATGFGSVDGTGRSVIDLTSLLPASGFIIQGKPELLGRLGTSVASAGDVNGDGFDDLIVGAPFSDDGGVDAGKAYLVFGKASGFGTVDGTGRAVVDLVDLADDDGFVIMGDNGGDYAGNSVSSAGDINGDGFADLMVGAPYPRAPDGIGRPGAVYVLFGGAFGGLVTTTGTAAAEILIGGLGDDTLSGGGGADSIRGGNGDDVLSVGDLTFRSVDGGGGSDTLGLAGTGLTLDLSSRTQAAKVSEVEAVDLTGTGNNTLTLDRLAVLNEIGADADGVHVLTVKGNAGDTVSFVDVQWSNAGTIVDGAITYDRYVDGNAEVRVANDVTVSFPARFDLTVLRPSQGFIIQGDAAADQAGKSVSSAGDVNGDGFADLIVGVPFGDDGGSAAGEAYVVFGHASGFGTVDGTGRAVIDLSNVGSSFTATQGFVIQGDAADDRAGWSVSSAGDVNGDGFADLIVGAFHGNDGGTAAGEAYVVFGRAAGLGTVNGTGRAVLDLSNVGSSFTAAQGFIIQGDVAADYGGWSVSSAGDVNGDGFADLMVGAPFGDDGGSAAGEAYVVFGHASGFGTVDGTGRAVIDLSNIGSSFTAAQGFVIQGDATNDQAGWSVSSAGDVNGDGFADLMVGARFGSDGGSLAGEAYVVFGHASGFGTVNGTGRAVIDLSNVGSSFTATQGFVIQGDAAVDVAGWSVSSAGDVNGDGFADLIVGAPGGDDGGNYAGEAYVVFGHASDFGTVDATGRVVIDLSNVGSSFTGTVGFVIQGDTAVDKAGVSVSSAGDVNGDGFADLIVGALLGDDGGGNAGEAYVLFGKASGFGTVDGTGRAVVDLTTITDDGEGFVIQGDAPGDQAGYSVSSADDVNGDGFADLIVGAPFGSDGGNAAGEAYVLFGGAFGGSTTPVTTTGTAGAEMLIGGLGDDTLSGGGGADSIRSGAGDDTLSVVDLAFRSVDGGGGFDTLVLLGAGQNFNFTTLADNKLSNIETVDITGSGNNSLTLGFADVSAINDGDPFAFTVASSHNALVVEGNAGDSLTLVAYDPDGAGGLDAATWTLVHADVGLDGSTGGAYDIYDLVRGSTVLASVAMDADISKI